MARTVEIGSGEPETSTSVALQGPTRPSKRQARAYGSGSVPKENAARQTPGDSSADVVA